MEASAMPSRRSLLGALTATPIVMSATAILPWQGALTALYDDYADSPAVLRRTKDGRCDSEFRYNNAESFFLSIERGVTRDGFGLLYYTGIVMQLGLSAHLFDVGFNDEWCRRYIGLSIAKSLAYANATGFGYHDPETDLLAVILTPYGKWRNAMRRDQFDEGPLTAADLSRLARALLDHIQCITGHPHPTWWKNRHA